MRLVLEGLRRRFVLALVAWVCATVLVATAVLGAVFAKAAAESDLRDVLDSSPLRAAVSFEMLSPDHSEQLYPDEARAALDSGAVQLRSRYFAPPVTSMYLPARPYLPGQAGAPFAPVVFRSDACAHLRLLQGRCPRSADETVVSARNAALNYGWHVGRDISLSTGPDGTPVTSRIVGEYAPLNSQDPYWGGPQYFEHFVTPNNVQVDAFFVPRSFFFRIARPAPVRVALDHLLIPSRVRLADLPDLSRSVQRFRAWSDQHGRAFTVDTDLAAVLRQAAVQRAAIDASTALVVLQLCVLGWVTLFGILQQFIGSRDAEVVLARMRGYRLGALVRFTCAESLVVLLLAVPSGLLLGSALADRLAAAALLPGTPVALPVSAPLAALGVVAGGLAAVAVSAALLLRRTVAQQSRRTRRDAVVSRSSIVAAALVVAAAGGAFALLRSSAGASPAGLLAPGLLILAVGVAAAAVLPLLLATVVRRTAASRRIALSLAVRQVVRRPAARRLLALLTVAVGLVVFGVSGEAIAAQNRDARAAVELSATAVQRITVRLGDDPVAEVRRADPQGRWAAAAARWLSFGGPDLRGALLAVDSSRPRAVAPAVPGVQDPAALAGRIGPPVEPVVVHGRRASLQADAEALAGDAPSLVLQLADRSGASVDVQLGDLGPGVRAYSASIPCTDGCTLVGVGLGSPVSGHDAHGSLLLRRLTVDGRAVAAGFAERGAWRSQRPLGDAHDRVEVDRRGLLDRFALGLGGTGGVAQQGLPVPVPAVVTGSAVARAALGSRLTVTSSDDSTTTLRVVGRQQVLPRVLDDGVLVDATAFRAALPTFVDDATWTIWIGPHAPADARARLQRAGLILDGPATALADRRAALSRQGPALALLLLQVMGVAGIVCAVCGVVVSIRAVLRRRSYEAAALRTVGVTRRQLLAAIGVEQGLLLGSAVVLGLPVGLLAAALALPALRQSNTASPVPQVAVPPAFPVVVVMAVLVAAVLVAVAVSAARVDRAARAARLREGEE